MNLTRGILIALLLVILSNILLILYIEFSKVDHFAHLGDDVFADTTWVTSPNNHLRAEIRTYGYIRKRVETGTGVSFVKIWPADTLTDTTSHRNFFPDQDTLFLQILPRTVTAESVRQKDIQSFYSSVGITPQDWSEAGEFFDILHERCRSYKSHFFDRRTFYIRIDSNSSWEFHLGTGTVYRKKNMLPELPISREIKIPISRQIKEVDQMPNDDRH